MTDILNTFLGKTCQDLNECALDPTLCAGGVCVNTEGSYTCRLVNCKILFIQNLNENQGRRKLCMKYWGHLIHDSTVAIVRNSMC